jgi:VanZ family protein
MTGVSDPVVPAGRQSVPAWPALTARWRRPAMTLWLAAVAAVMVLSLLPATAPPGDYGFDKMAHAASYCCLALLAHLAFARRPTALLAALAMIPLGCLIEVAQTFVPPRTGDVWDAAANSIGALAGIMLGTRARRIAGAMMRDRPVPTVTHTRDTR